MSPTRDWSPATVITLPGSRPNLLAAAAGKGGRRVRPKGGGGNGGIAAARAVNISGDPEIPAISLSASIGGKGGAGNTAGTVGLGNSGLITTAGDGAVGVMAQSIGGGGGNGGGSTG